MPEKKQKKTKQRFDFTMYNLTSGEGRLVMFAHVAALVVAWAATFVGIFLKIFWIALIGAILLFVIYLSVLIWAIILYHERDLRVINAADKMEAGVANLELGNLERVDSGSKNPGMIKLQERINRMIEALSRYQVIYSDAAQDPTTRRNIQAGFIFPREEFIRRVDQEIQRGQNFRAALVLVRLDKIGNSFEEDLQDMLKLAKEIFPGAMIGKMDKTTYGFYLFQFDGILSLRMRCENLVSNFYKLDLGQINGGETAIGCRVAACVYPYVFRNEIFQKAEAAINNPNVPISVDIGSDAIYFPRLIMTEDGKRSVFESALETFEKRFKSAETREQALTVLREMASWLVKSFGCSSCGLLRYDQAGGRYTVFFEEGEDPVFGQTQRKLEAEVVDPFYDAAFEDPYFAVNDVAFLPRQLSQVCQNLGVKSLYLKALNSLGTKQGLIFVLSKNKNDLSGLLSHDILTRFAHLASEMIEGLELQMSIRGHGRIIDALGAKTHRYLYSVDRNTHRIAFISQNLQRLFPDAKPGEICYKVLRENHDAPCSHCPLVHGPEERVIPKISTMPSTISILEKRGTDNDLSTLVIEPLGQENVANTSNKLLDDATGIHNQRALTLSLNRDIKNNEMGYVLAIQIHDLNSFAASFPGANGDAIMAQIARNLQDAGYEDVLYRYDVDTICLYLSGYTKTRAITLVEEAAEILSTPITIMAASNVPQATFALAGYPSDITSFRELQTAFMTSFEEAKKLGPGNLMLQGRQKPRRALRSEYVTNVLKDAVENRKISVLLQPIVSAKTWKADSGDIRAALSTPEGTPVAPAEFIPLAVKSKLVSKVDMSSLQNLGELYNGPGSSTLRGGGINHLDMYLSIESIYDPEFPKAVIQAFETYRFPKNYLTFEIRTQFLEEHPNEVMELQKALLGRSIVYSASDFDYERDNLDTLKQFGITHLKTATRSVKTALSNQRDMNAFSRFVNTAIVAGFSICATGIETEEEARFASSFDIALLEGYFFGRPMNQEDFLNAITYGSKSRE